MKKYVRRAVAGLIYGFLPVVLALGLIHSLEMLALAIGSAIGLEQSLTLQIAQALQQLQNAQIVMPWLAGALLGIVASFLLMIVKGRKGRRALIVIGAILLLPLTLGAFCLAQINQVQVWRELLALAQWL